MRPDGADMFGYGSREAVLAALRADPADVAPFGSPVPAEELVSVLTGLFGPELGAAADGDGVRCSPADRDLRAVLGVGFAHGWVTVRPGDTAEVRFSPVTP